MSNEGLSKLSKTIKTLTSLKNVDLKLMGGYDSERAPRYCPKMTNSGLSNLSKALKIKNSLQNLTLFLNG